MDQLKISEERLDQILNSISTDLLDSYYQDLGGRKTDGRYSFVLFDHRLLYDTETHQFQDFDNCPITLAIKTVVSSYMQVGLESVRKAASAEPEKDEKGQRLVTLRELSQGGPLVSNFTTNTAKTIEQSFTGKTGLLEEKCQALGGLPLTMAGYDISYRFNALPKVPVLLNFNDVDDGMPAQAGFLFRENALNFLDEIALGILCTYLTGRLIS